MKLNHKLLVSISLLLTPICASEEKGNLEGMSLLQQISRAYAQIAKKAMPATVSIKTLIETHRQNNPLMHDPFTLHDELFQQFFGGSPFANPLHPMVPEKPVEGRGSGFIVREDGYIVTNYHVIKDTAKIIVVLNDGKELNATVKGTDPETDLAVLKIDAKDLPCLNFGDSDEIQVGECVIAIGNPWGLEATLTTGTISAKGRQGLGLVPREDFIQTDAAINPGNSGGPLLNLDGDVVGVNSAIVMNGYGNGFAIPSKMAQHVIDQIIDGGAVKKAFLGIVPQQISKEMYEASELSQEGVLVAEVVKNSPAESAGLKQGDIITSFNGKKIKSAMKLVNDVALSTPGKAVDLEILREKKPLHFSVVLGSHSESEMDSQAMMQKLGIEVDNLSSDYMNKLGFTPDAEGVVVTKVKPGSPAAIAGIRPGFLITGISPNLNTAYKKVKNINDFQEALKEVADKRHAFFFTKKQNITQCLTVRMP